MARATDDGWAAALGQIPSGLFVLTARRAHDATGLLASWVQQCSFDPPRLTVAVRAGRPVLDWLTDDTPFALHILPEDAKPLVAHFGKGLEPGRPAFDGLNVRQTDNGPPVLLDALAYLECRVCGRFPAGDHVLVLGEVDRGAVLRAGRPAVHLRKNGLRY